MRIDRALPGSPGQVSNRRNLTGANADIARVPGRAGSVDNVTICDHQVEGSRLAQQIGR